jgi:hypothetical protein
MQHYRRAIGCFAWTERRADRKKRKGGTVREKKTTLMMDGERREMGGAVLRPTVGSR